MKIGLKYFKYAKITESGDTETFGTVKTAAKAMTLSVSVNRADTKGYADDGVAESDPAFIDGSVTLEGDDLTNEVIADLCGAALASSGDDSGDLTFAEADEASYVRFGFVVPMIKGGVKKWIGIIFLHVKFAAPEDNYQTKGQSIEFRGWSMTGEITKNLSGEWKMQSARKDSEAAAATWLDGHLSPSA